MRLLVLVEDLKLGGVQRAAAALSQSWAQGGHEVSLLTFEDENEQGLYPVSKDINYIQFGDPRYFGSSKIYFGKVAGAFRAIFKLRSFFRHVLKNQRSFVAIGFLAHMCFYGRIASLGLPIYFISTERTYTPGEFGRRALLLNLAKYVCFYLSDRIIVLTREAYCYFPKFLQRKTRVIPNTLHLNDVPPSSDSSSINRERRRKTVLWVGRLSREKRPDLAIRAFARIARLCDDWDLILAGDGPERPKLQSLVRDLDLDGRIKFLGIVLDVRELYAHADLFILSSDHEGFPNALCEAMQYGVCSISTECSTGPREIISSGRDGFLAPVGNIEAFSKQMKIVMNDDELRIKTGLSGQKSIQRFTWPNIAPLWESLFKELS